MNRIVVIEDDPSIRRGLVDRLRMESYDVLAAADGEEGYRLIREKQPDLVILDLMLPRMNGYEVCRQMRRSGLITPVLMLTAQAEEINRIDGFEAGADDYVTKPFSIRELLGRVRAILRRSEGRSDIVQQKELDEARRIQERLLPSEIPQISGLKIAGTSRPARIVGGDYFDVLKLDRNTIALCIADVCGKGMPAALMMANLQAAVKAYASRDASPREVCTKLNRVMCENMAANGFITFFYAVVDGNEMRCTYCNAGHNAPILVSGGNLTRRLDCGGGVLGVMAEWQYEQEEVTLLSGDRLLMYTDGITESRNGEHEEFGEERLIHLLLNDENDPVQITGEAIDASSRFSNGQFEDDLTVVAISVE